jgi:hypothetical protein
MEKLLESITQVRYYSYWIRCWREEEQILMEGQVDRKAMADLFIKTEQEIKTHLHEGVDPWATSAVELADFILKLDRMNAVEVKDERNNGCVIYKDWP